MFRVLRAWCRRVAWCACLALAAVLVAIMTVTWFYKYERRDHRWETRLPRIAVFYGGLEFDYDRRPAYPLASRYSSPFGVEHVFARNVFRRRGWLWLPKWDRPPPPATGFTAAIPLWMPLSAAVVVMTGLRLSRSRPLADVCPCGYSLTGLAPGAPCPECGRGRG